jgi:hypothetical protein
MCARIFNALKQAFSHPIQRTDIFPLFTFMLFEKEPNEKPRSARQFSNFSTLPN